jgi:peptidoglycan/LPS O-acetylase OafA/YrhL
MVAICIVVGGLNKVCWFLVFNYSSILIGCLLALSENKLKECIGWKRCNCFTYGALVTIIVLQLAIAAHVDSSWAMAITDACYAVAVANFLFGIVTEETTVRRLLSWPILGYVGKISYGIYLIHVVVLNFSRKIVSQEPAIFILTTILSALTAAVLYKFFERPLIGIGRQLSERILKTNNTAVELSGNASGLRADFDRFAGKRG